LGVSVQPEVGWRSEPIDCIDWGTRP